MQEASYYLDKTMKVVEHPSGFREVGVKKSARFPYEDLDTLGKIEDQFVYRVKRFREMFEDESLSQESGIDRDLETRRFFEEESKRYKWGFNTSFDKKRMQVSEQIFDLEKEKRKLRTDRLKEILKADEKIRDAERKRFPFRDLVE